jgi:hypothetical protein
MFFESFCISRFCKTGNRLSRKLIYAAKTCNPFFLSLLAVNNWLLAFSAQATESVALLLNENSS